MALRTSSVADLQFNTLPVDTPLVLISPSAADLRLAIDRCEAAAKARSLTSMVTPSGLRGFAFMLTDASSRHSPAYSVKPGRRASPDREAMEKLPVGGVVRIDIEGRNPQHIRNTAYQLGLQLKRTFKVSHDRDADQMVVGRTG
jgi:hypothetical protein